MALLFWRSTADNRDVQAGDEFPLPVRLTPEIPAVERTIVSRPLVANVESVVFAANAQRTGATVYNEGAATVYVLLGAGATTTRYTVQITNAAYYEVPFGYKGDVTAITSASTAQLMATETAVG